MIFDPREHPHKRFNPLTNEWILVSPHRAKRPWQGQEEELPPENRPQYDPKCYLCPGNKRAGNVTNPSYEEVFVFDNDFPALLTDTPSGKEQQSLLLSKSERGICRVICFSPRHDLALPRMETTQIQNVIEVWSDQFSELESVPWISYVQIFENRGAMMGCSNPHPHCQIWASESIPNEPAKETVSQERHRRDNGCCLLCTYTKVEQQNRERIVLENDDFLVVVPFWAVWPFETLLISRRHLSGLDQLSNSEKGSLAGILNRLTTRYDNLFRTSFPYSMGFHQRPTDGKDYPGWHLHAHFYPPLLRSATVRKFMVGYEMLGAPQRDITAETAAERLRQLPDIHWNS